MGRSCREIHEWIEEEVEQPIEEWENRQERRCRERSCNWWCLCCNKWFCWLVWVLVKVIRWVIVTVGKWVVRVVCEVVNFVLDVIGAIIELILSIPIIGGILRTIINWVLEIVWRIISLPEFLASLAGLRLRKRMYFGVIIPVIDDVPLMAEADIQPWVNTAIEIYNRTCNIDLRFTGFCRTSVRPPGGTITVDCGAGGFFADWWLDGSWFQFASLACKFQSNWRRVTGYGGEIIVFIVNDITGAVGCSMSATHDYVTVQVPPGPFIDTVAHELGHACLLTHVTSADGNNLLDTGGRATALPVLTNLQIATVRSSRHCVYF
jgi:hypothetical protein